MEGDTDVSVNKEVEPLRPDEAHRVIETQNRSMDAADTAYNQSQSLFEQLIQAQHPNSASSNDRPPN